ncbi:hypothetical protein [Jannaschia ovalis]|uniref:DUF2842 domain-containing protein n=1 Tax=Jannaschia ovalis TaxID=3038773 RepID=A0ABY8LEV8_9RHOB|nr:hypothetical protein [Jannaschia sp. GRR-S6-38]WGH79821.1 hypothetical protein P8627_06045 [Jannaschia sp. GRR-S6-38]
MSRTQSILIWAILIAIVLAHVALWRSSMPAGAKLSFTVLNAVGWAIVLGPIWIIPRWLDAIRARNAEADTGPAAEPSDPDQPPSNRDNNSTST